MWRELVTEFSVKPLLAPSGHEEEDEYNTMVVKEDDNDSEVSCLFLLVLV